MLGYDKETEIFYCYCLDNGNEANPLTYDVASKSYLCSNCGRKLSEHEAEMERYQPWVPAWEKREG